MLRLSVTAAVICTGLDVVEFAAGVQIVTVRFVVEPVQVLGGGGGGGEPLPTVMLMVELNEPAESHAFTVMRCEPGLMFSH